MRKVAIFTGTRAEYGLLYRVMEGVKNSKGLDLKLLVSGAHLSPEFGLTYMDIEQDGFVIDEKVEMLVSSDASSGVAKSMGLGVIGFSYSLEKLAPDLLIVLGDRYEALAVAQVAFIMRIPILHIHGGEITEGAYDDSIRHAITKFSAYHCTATDNYRHRVIQLGEEPDRVFTVGALGLENINKMTFLSLEELSKSLDFNLSEKFFLVTYHPETLSTTPSEETIINLIEALKKYEQYKVLITLPNADDGSRQITKMINHQVETHKSFCSAVSLGQKRYLSAMKHATAVIGNSSSGIIEAPSLNVPTVNIGNRQQGRLAAKSVINVTSEKVDIENGISRAIDMKMSQNVDVYVNPYFRVDPSSKIVNLIRDIDLKKPKKFFDLGYLYGN